MYCNVIGSHCTVLWDKLIHSVHQTLLFFMVGGWLTRLNMTCTLWKQARLTIPKGCEVAADAATVTGQQKVSCIKDQ